MRKLFLSLSILFLLVGCAQLKQAKVDATACMVDPVCRAEAVKQAEIAKGIAKDISGVSPIPLSTNVVGGVAYGVALLISWIKLGKKKREAV